MTGRRLWVLAVIALVMASCDASPETTETTETTIATTTTTTAPVGRMPLQANGPAFISQGDRGAFVEALQAYLVCVGVDQPDESGPSVTVDGSFGPVTASAVAYYQAQLRRVPSGNPDEETFAMLARECGAPRMLTFPPGESAMEVAGNAAPDDDEIFVFQGSAGQVLRLAVLEGAVTITAEDADGAPVTGADAATSVDIELTSERAYTIRLSAAAAASYLLLAETRSPNVLVSDFGPMVLRNDGVGVAELGNEFGNTAAVISLILLNPWNDSDWRDDVAACPGTHRAVTWLIQAGAGTDVHPALLTAYFTEVDGTGSFVEYRYESLDLASLDPLAQGLATRDGISIGSTLVDFVEALGAPSLDAQGAVTLPDGLVVVFDVVGDAGSPDEALSRVRVIRAGSGGCRSL